MMRVFVYGTLMAGCGNHRLLRSSVRLMPATTKPEFTMVSLGWYPGIVRGGTTKIVGELYEVGHATLASLDQLEGHPHFYERMTIDLEDGTTALAYVLPAKYLESHGHILSGSWRDEMRVREQAMYEDAADTFVACEEDEG